MRVSDFWMPNQALERTAAERLGFDMVGFIDIIRHSLSALPAAVAQLGRYTKSSYVFGGVQATWRIERLKGSAFGGRTLGLMTDALRGRASPWVWSRRIFEL